MIRVTGTGPNPIALDISGGQGNLRDEQEVHVMLHNENGIFDMGWFRKSDLEVAILRSTHPVFTRTAPYPPSERNSA